MNGDQKNFFSSLFDFDFKSFITIRFLKLIYIVLLALMCLGGAIWFLTGLFGIIQGEAIGLLAMIAAPIITLIYIVILRISLEAVVVFFRIGENTSTMVSLMQGGTPGPGNAPSGHPGTPPSGQPGPPPPAY